MTVAGISSNATYQTAQTTVEKNSTLDYDSFLKLLVAEMSHQDPLNPTDSTQYISQFASFSSVEQAIQTNKKLDSMMAVSALTQANSLIGRTATSADGEVTGVVEAVRVVDGGVQAVLAGGKTLMLESGTSVA